MRRRSLILISVFILVSLVLVVGIRGEVKEVGGGEHWTQVGELHSVIGVKNHWVISTDTVLEVESFQRISIPFLNWESDWRSNGFKNVRSLVGTDTYTRMEEKGEWDVYASIDYSYMEKNILGIVKINYIVPRYLKGLKRENHEECSTCNSFEDGIVIKNQQISKEIPISSISSQSTEKNTVINFQIKNNEYTELNVSSRLIENVNQPYILITKQSRDKIYYKELNSTIHFQT